MPEISKGNVQNKPTEKQVKTRSLFPLSYPFLQTHRFGDITPHFCLDVVPDDKNVEFRSVGETRSYTLGAPLMQDIYVKKDYFIVDKRAILPIAADLIFTNPSVGDDVQSSVVGTSVSSFPSKLGQVFSKLWYFATANVTGASEISNLEALIYYVLTAEYFYSQGSLLANLGCHLSNLFSVKDDEQCVQSFDVWEDHIWSNLAALISSSSFKSVATLAVTIDGVQFAVFANEYDGSTYTAGPKVTLRQAIQMMRDNMAFSVTVLGSPAQGYAASVWNDWSAPTITTADYPIDLFRCFAYQISCSHYFTNDKVDPVYSAELYRQLINNYLTNFVSFAISARYTLNGLKYSYDWCSAYFFNQVVSSFASSTAVTVTSGMRSSMFPYLRAIFGYNRSLRYQDYFTGSRTRPLAIGNTSVAVNNNAVSVLDVTERIQAQRFFNAVNRTRRQLSEYVKGIFGVESPAPDFHDPQWLAHTEDIVYGSETENTGAAQLTQPNSVTSVLRGQSNKYAFSVDVDYQSVIIGVTYYDIQRMYKDFIERPYFHVNRFDYFNPYMQYIGDQPVYRAEFDPRTPNLSGYFGYQLRHMEYKQRIAQCAGGFAQFLPGYSFLADDQNTTFFNDPNTANEVQNSDFIRSWSFELDPFYVSLTGYSPASYFHFIVKNVNECNASRPMAFAPSIL